MEKLIEPNAYTPEIIFSIAKIKNRMRMTETKYTEDDIRVFEYGENIYILANPILGEEPVFDEFGRFERMIPMRNLTIMYTDLRRNIVQNNGNVVSVPIPRLRILRPDLCARISKTANSTEDR